MPELFHFAGFTGPRYTQTPDEVFDVLLPVLSGAELKVLLYIIRRTFGFKKDADAIALSQIQHGITRADGTRLDAGTGLAKSTAVEAIKRLEAMGIIEAVRSGKAGARGYESTTYRPRMAGTPLSDNPTSHVQKSDSALVRESNIQETDVTTNKNGSDVDPNLRDTIRTWAYQHKVRATDAQIAALAVAAGTLTRWQVVSAGAPDWTAVQRALGEG